MTVMQQSSLYMCVCVCLCVFSSPSFSSHQAIPSKPTQTPPPPLCRSIHHSLSSLNPVTNDSGGGIKVPSADKHTHTHTHTHLKNTQTAHAEKGESRQKEERGWGGSGEQDEENKLGQKNGTRKGDEREKGDREGIRKAGDAKDKVEERRREEEKKGGRCEVSLPVVPSLISIVTLVLCNCYCTHTSCTHTQNANMHSRVSVFVSV